MNTVQVRKLTKMAVDACSANDSVNDMKNDHVASTVDVIRLQEREQLKR